MMKKFVYYILMMATLSLGACSEGKDEPAIVQPTDKGQQVEQQDNPIPTEGDPIAFTARFDDGKADTKAITYRNETNIVYGITDFHDGIEDNVDLQQDGFGVYAYYTIDKKIGVDNFVNVDQSYKEIVMLNQKVEWENGKWTYAPPRFWPGSQNYMSFFAYAPWSDTNHPYIGTENTDYYYYNKNGGYWSFKYDKDIKIPTSSDWSFTDQEDLVWGMNGATGLPYKNVRRPDTKTASTPEGTLGWEFKHALARVKFTIFNLKDLFENPSMIIANGTDVINIAQGSRNEGMVAEYAPTAEVKTYSPDPSNPLLDEYYIELHETGNGTLCHKFEDIGDDSAILIITGVTFENVVKSADFSHDNTTPYEPEWTNKVVYGQDDVPAYDIAPSLLNQTIYMDNATLSLLPPNYDYTLLPGLRATTVPLTKPSGAGMDDKTHYFLFVPTKDDLKITIRYKIVRGFKLTGYYTWIDANTPPEHRSELGDFTMIGIQDQADGENTSTITVSIKDEEEQVLGFEANKSYHLALRLGKMLQVLFEVTDWDEPESITINVPSFD